MPNYNVDMKQCYDFLKDPIGLEKKSLEKTLNLYFYKFGNQWGIDEAQRLNSDIENIIMSQSLKIQKNVNNINVTIKKCIDMISKNNLEVVNNMIEEKRQRKRALENKLNMSRAKFLTSNMAKYMEKTIKECKKNEDKYIIEKLSSLEKPLCYDIDEGRNE